MRTYRQTSVVYGLAAAVLLTASPALAQTGGSGGAKPGAVATGPGSLSGIWFNSDYDKVRSPYVPRLQAIKTADGKAPPLQPWAAQLLEKRIEGSEAGHPYVTALSQCLPSGIPAMLLYPGLPIQILETPGQVTMLNEQNQYFRLIRMNAPHRRDPDPGFKGDSVGHWEGDTLVVDTVGLNDKTSLDQAGTPHSDELHVVERYRRISPDVIELVITLDDPKTFTRPWTTKTHFKPWGRPLEEYICENNRNQIVQGAVGVQMPGAGAH